MIAELELTGTIKLIMDAQTFASGFVKREFVLTTDDRYPQDVKFECVKEGCAMLDHLHPGYRCTVKFRVRGNEYNGRYYVNLKAYRIDMLGAEQPHQDEEVPPYEAQEQTAPVHDDGLPF